MPSIDQSIIDSAMVKHRTGDPISDLQAKVIANSYHDGQSSRFYMLASTGTIDNSDGQLGREFEYAERAARANGEEAAIAALKVYVGSKGTRGRQAGWSAISW